jgi:hypothetical protein
MLAQAYNESLQAIQMENHKKLKNLERQCKEFKQQAHHEAARTACLRMKIGRQNGDGTDEQMLNMSTKIIKLQYALKESEEKCSRWEKRYNAMSKKVQQQVRNTNPRVDFSTKEHSQNITPALTSRNKRKDDDDYTTGWRQSSTVSDDATVPNRTTDSVDGHAFAGYSAKTRAESMDRQIDDDDTNNETPFSRIENLPPQNTSLTSHQIAMGNEGHSERYESQIQQSLSKANDDNNVQENAAESGNGKRIITLPVPPALNTESLEDGESTPREDLSPASLSEITPNNEMQFEIDLQQSEMRSSASSGNPTPIVQSLGEAQFELDQDSDYEEHRTVSPQTSGMPNKPISRQKPALSTTPPLKSCNVFRSEESTTLPVPLCQAGGEDETHVENLAITEIDMYNDWKVNRLGDDDVDIDQPDEHLHRNRYTPNAEIFRQSFIILQEVGQL